MTEILTILVLEDDPEDFFFLKATLDKMKAKDIEPQIRITTTLQEALSALNDREFDLIITDLFLPDSQGLDTFVEIQKRAESIPIIIVGGLVDEDLAREAVSLGAQDYIPKSELNANHLSRIIHHAIERHRLQESLKALSFTDELTKLYNRRGFITLLEQQMALARRTKKGFYIFIIDLDYLKQINDSYGHLMGDKALIDTAAILRSSLRRHDIIGRIGGDEFALVAINAAIESGEYLKQHMIDKVTEFNLRNPDQPYILSFSIGKTFYDGIREITLDELLQKADIELYKEKRITHEKLKVLSDKSKHDV